MRQIQKMFLLIFSDCLKQRQIARRVLPFLYLERINSILFRDYLNHIPDPGRRHINIIPGFKNNLLPFVSLCPCKEVGSPADSCSIRLLIDQPEYSISRCRSGRCQGGSCTLKEIQHMFLRKLVILFQGIFIHPGKQKRQRRASVWMLQIHAPFRSIGRRTFLYFFD